MEEALSKLVTLALQAGPFAAVVMVFIWWREMAERKTDREASLLREQELQKRHDLLQEKYDALVARFVSLAGDSNATLKNWHDVMIPLLGKE
jgi:hypothetical protein